MPWQPAKIKYDLLVLLQVLSSYFLLFQLTFVSADKNVFNGFRFNVSFS